MTLLTQKLKDSIKVCANTNALGFYNWNNKLPSGSIDYKQLNDSTVGVQVFIPNSSDYEGYSKVKNELNAIFSENQMHFYEEIDLSVKNGWFKQLNYITIEEKDRIDEQMKREEERRVTSMNI
jgi:hypothetical protein